MRARTIIGAAACLLIAPALAQAAGWVQVTAKGPSTDQVGLLRTADGKLHVAWPRTAGPITEDLLHTTLAPSGKLLATTPIESGWAEIANPALVPQPGGSIRVFWGGIRTTDPAETNKELNTALSFDGGATWVLQTGSVVPDGGQAYGSSVSAAALPDGSPLETWAGTLGTWVHSGLVPDAPNFDLQAPLGTYGYDPGIAADAAGRAVVAWYSNAAGNLGVYAQDVGADGAPVGAALRFPGTANMKVGQLSRTAIVARPGEGSRPVGGFYVAYPTGYPTLNRIRVWRVGAAGATTVARTGSNSVATLAADDEGRLWVAWTEEDGGRPQVFARRSDPSGRVFGEVVEAGRPARAFQAYHLDASATRGALDILGSFSIGATADTATSHARVLPGLTLKSSRLRIPDGQATPVTFTVLDAGDPVQGARVRAGGASATTNLKGKVTLQLLAATRTVTARASSAGYVGADQVLRVIRP